MHPLEVSFNAIAKTYGVKVCHCKTVGQPWESDHETGEVCIGVCDGSEEWYFRALHEVGHRACGHTGQRLIEALTRIISRATLETEAEAWIWALDHAAIAPGLAARRDMAWRFSTYARCAVDAGPLSVALVERVTGERVSIPA